MSEFMPDDSQLACLKTWYPVDHPLHFDPRHPCIKLAGEAGEILDLYGKEEYKPNFSWWDCKHCGQTEDDIFHGQEKYSHQYTPLILDELGDYLYYLRILAYQKQVTFESLCKQYKKQWSGCEIIEILSDLAVGSSLTLSHFIIDGEVILPYLVECTISFLAILDKLNTPLSQVLDLNYKKLNSEETAHGWKSATIKTRS